VKALGNCPVPPLKSGPVSNHQRSLATNSEKLAKIGLVRSEAIAHE